LSPPLCPSAGRTWTFFFLLIVELFKRRDSLSPSRTSPQSFPVGNSIGLPFFSRSSFKTRSFPRRVGGRLSLSAIAQWSSFPVNSALFSYDKGIALCLFPQSERLVLFLFAECAFFYFLPGLFWKCGGDDGIPLSLPGPLLFPKCFQPLSDPFPFSSP